LLKTILVLAENNNGRLDADSKDSIGDILNLLTSTIVSTTPSDDFKTSHLRLCLNVLERIRILVPEAQDVTKLLIREHFSKVEQLLAT